MDKGIIRTIKFNFECVLKELESHDLQLESFKNFKDFFAEIDVINGYEEDWKTEKGIWKSYLHIIWSEHLKNQREIKTKKRI